MANPQKEDGYTAISNELMEQFAKLKLPVYEWRCLLAILRETYGWSRKSAEMSITRLQKMTGLKRMHASRSLNALIDKKIIRCTSTGTGKVRNVGIQKDYTQWLGVPLQVQAKGVPLQVQKCTSTGDSRCTSTGTANGLQTRAGIESAGILKQNIKQYKTKDDFFSFKKRYSNPHLIDQTVEAIKSTRKTRKISPNILSNLFQQFEKYPAEAVEQGCQVYLEKKYSLQGKDEKYLLGIVRKLKSQKPSTPTYQPPPAYKEGDEYA